MPVSAAMKGGRLQITGGIPMASNLPSSYSRSGATQPPQAFAPPQAQSAPRAQPLSGPESSPAIYVAILALIVAFASIYISFVAERPLSQGQKDILLSLANDLKTLQDREIALSAPVATTIELNRSYPISELFPAQFDIPIDFNIPVDTQLVGVSTTGAPVAFKVQESVPVKAVIPISSAKAFGNKSILIQKTLPVEAKFTSIVKIRTAYGTDLNNMIDKLESLAGKSG